MNPFNVIVADPPWQFSDKLPGAGRGADKHYDTLAGRIVNDLTLPPIADDAHLFLWRVSGMSGWNTSYATLQLAVRAPGS